MPSNFVNSHRNRAIIASNVKLSICIASMWGHWTLTSDTKHQNARVFFNRDGSV